MILLLSLIFLTLPALAMMHRSGHMHGEKDTEKPLQQQGPGVEQRQPEHRHGEYYHSHDGGELPHSHYQEKATPPEQNRTSDGGTPADESPESPREKAVHDEHGSPGFPLPVGEKAVVPWHDDMIMRLIPEGRIDVPQTRGATEVKQISVNSFYLDETPVTNHQYVDFLNKNLSVIEVENGIVRGNDEIWLLLGEVKEVYEPIIFKDGNFIVNGVHHAACAVLRVTGHGASAYAGFHGKRLLTEAEWMHAVINGNTVPTNLPVPSPVLLYQANEYGIRALNSNIGEWGLRIDDAATGESSDTMYVVLGGMPGGPSLQNEAAPGLHRYPWEAFAEVGFRTVLDVRQQ